MREGDIKDFILGGSLIMIRSYRNLKVALVHDYLIRLGGAERVLLNLKNIFSKAPIYTLIYDDKKIGEFFKGIEIKTSFLQKFPGFLRKKHRVLALLMPSAIESFDLSEFDLVISSSSIFAKGLVLRPKTVHICYCHSPARFLWDYSFKYQSRFSRLRKIFFHYLRIWDRSAANRVDYFIANSKATAARIKKYYGRESTVIYPPISLKASKKNGALEKQRTVLSGDFFLIVSQLTPYKQIDLAIEAFNKLELPLVIIGEGKDWKRLRKIAKKNIRFLGWQSDEAVIQYYQNCRAFIFPGEDDFGLAPVEAMSFGKPVLAFRAGGAMETVLEGITGEFFDDSASEALADGVRRLLVNLKNYNPLVIKKRAEEFSKGRFEKEMVEFVEKICYYR